ncbi:MAG TPA: RhuM family protein, partial [Rhodocyclaceae bacterium]|nr:RhuM family protein [Rhodocyclaceae bacterium]HNA31378.1 RhuM family protein [Thiobacillaceae bacterium]
MDKTQGEILLYQTPEGGPAMEVRLELETVWLTQVQMAELFGVNVPAVFKHIKNIFATGELQSEATVSKMEIVRQEGKRQVRRVVEHYSLDMVISVGYRVNSLRGTQFRIWATNVLRQHLVQGYTIHERRLKELNQAVRLIADVAHRRTLSGDEATALLDVVADYSYAL